MNDERLFARLAAHAGPADVDPGFEDRLYALLQLEMRRPERSARPALLLVAALVAILVISAVVGVGSGLIELPWVDGSPTPDPSAAASESSGPSPTPLAPSAHTWTATGEMIEARSGPATLLLDGRVLVAGGTDSVGFLLGTAELYDPTTGSWTATGSMLEARLGHTATQLPDGRVLVAGGGEVGGGTAELYDPASGTWTATGSLVTPRWFHTATLLPDGRVLVAGGSAVIGGDSPLALASAEVYDPSSGTWTATGNMIEAREAHTATLLLNGKVLVAGGSGSADSTGSSPLFESAELYDPGSGSWTATGAMLVFRAHHTATRLPDGTVLVAGGMPDTSAAELYEPSTGQWTATGSMIESRISHTATLLPDGTVMVAGGTDSVIDGGVASSSAELYDPLSGSWTATASMTEARAGHTATLLLNGKVLVAAGGSSSGLGLASAELYDPGTGR